MVAGLVNTGAASATAVEAPLNEIGQKLLVQYSGQFTNLQMEIVKALPALDEQKKAAFVKARAAEKAAEAEMNATLGASELKKAQDALALAQRNTQQALTELNLTPFLSSDKLDTQLVKYVVLSDATPRGLAAFAQQGEEQAAWLDKLLADDGLMKQMVSADGAKAGKYGQAMKIYADIQKASAKAKEGPLQKLALGVSLEHAVPVEQSNAATETNAPAVVDPVKRYLHFEKAFLNGELDPGFQGLSVWDYRLVVNGNEPDQILAWGREMLRNYRPDEVTTSDYRWRYVKAVKTEVQYGAGETKNDIPSLNSYQNIINTGGVCGRRAFFGRYILRCFGIPTIARPQPGHAALAHWTPDGWVINLGGGWGAGKTMFSGRDVDFLAHTQARMAGKSFAEVQRAQWIGLALGEKRAFGFSTSTAASFWNEMALCRQRQIIEEAKAVTLAAVGTDIGEANVSKEKEVEEKTVVTEADRKIVVSQDGSITIPAAACSSLGTNAEKIVLMKSFLGGLQLHYSRNGAPTVFEYAVEAPAAGKYALRAQVVTVSPNQHLFVAVNDAQASVDIALPYTIGMWDKTQPVEVTLAEGKNVLRCSRNEPVRGVTLKDFTLQPVN